MAVVSSVSYCFLCWMGWCSHTRIGSAVGGWGLNETRGTRLAGALNGGSTARTHEMLEKMHEPASIRLGRLDRLYRPYSSTIRVLGTPPVSTILCDLGVRH